MVIPKTLDECFVELGKIFNKFQLEEFKAKTEDELAIYHFGLGLWMRNNWGLWCGSPLAKYFNSMGIFHADDMSGIILRSFHRHLKCEELRLEKQIEFFQEYWKRGSMPSGTDK